MEIIIIILVNKINGVRLKMTSEVKQIEVPVLKMTHKDLMCSDEELAKDKLKVLCEFLEKCPDMCITYEMIDDGADTDLEHRIIEIIKI